MQEAGLRIATVWNRGVDLSEADARAYLDHVPDLLGLTIQDASEPLRVIGDRVPRVRMALSYGDNADILKGGIDAQLATFDGSAPPGGWVRPTAITSAGSSPA